jgi:SAM-dependent methyltransferase
VTSETQVQPRRREQRRGLFDAVAELYDACRRGYPAEIAKTASEHLADTGPFDLIVSATAFHWVDPGVGLAKAARLLRPGGWLALLTTGESYPEQLQTGLRELWTRYSRPSETWAGQPAWLTALRETTLFGETVEASHARALRLPVETVLGVERTRATFLSYSKQDQAGFTADLRALLAVRSHIDLVQETFLAMAPAAGSR